MVWPSFQKVRAEKFRQGRDFAAVVLELLFNSSFLPDKIQAKQRALLMQKHLSSTGRRLGGCVVRTLMGSIS